MSADAVNTGSLAALLAGLSLGASLIIAIGAQNAFVLRAGLARDHVAAVVATCVACDWALIAAGAVGFGALIEAFPALTSVAAWGGAAFLVVYGAMSFRSAAHPGSLKGGAARPVFSGTAAAIGATLGVSLLNPHVYLDTVVLLGSVASGYPPSSRILFVAGAWVASLVWFSALGFGARLLSGLFASERTWRALDVAIGIIMWGIAASLIAGELL